MSERKHDPNPPAEATGGGGAPSDDERRAVIAADDTGMVQMEADINAVEEEPGAG